MPAYNFEHNVASKSEHSGSVVWVLDSLSKREGEGESGTVAYTAIFSLNSEA